MNQRPSDDQHDVDCHHCDNDDGVRGDEHAHIATVRSQKNIDSGGGHYVQPRQELEEQCICHISGLADAIFKVTYS